MCNPSFAFGQLIKRRRKVQRGLEVAQCSIGLLLPGNKEQEAQEEEE